MMIRSLWFRCAPTIAIVALVLGRLAPTTPGNAQSDAAAPASIETARLALDRLEATLKSDVLSTEKLVGLAETSVPIREMLQARTADLEPRAARAEARLKQLGPAPAADAPPEPEALAAERARLTKNFAALDAELKQARLLVVRAEQVTQTIAQRRYGAYVRELFARSWSILDPRF